MSASSSTQRAHARGAAHGTVAGGSDSTAAAAADTGGYAPDGADARPVYSEVMEDGEVVASALRVAEGETVVCVASAGDNVFHAALEPARHVFGVDISPRQIELCRLKEAALLRFEWRDYAELCGALPASAARRVELLRGLPGELAAQLLADARAREAFETQGLCAVGRLSAFVAPLRDGLAAIVGRPTLHALLGGASASERARVWNERFERSDVLDFLGAALNEETISDSFIPSAAYGRMAEPKFHEFYKRVLRHLTVELDPASNYFLHRLWSGAYPPSGALPPYLQREHHERLRARVGAISWFQADVLEFLRHVPRASVHAFNLSNVLDWCAEPQYVALWNEIERVAAPNARVFLRSFLAARALPAELAARWRTDAKLSADMAWRDRVGYYSRYESWTRA